MILKAVKLNAAIWLRKLNSQLRRKRFEISEEMEEV